MSGVLYAARDQRLYTSGLLLNDGGEIYAGRDILIADATARERTPCAISRHDLRRERAFHQRKNRGKQKTRI